jgi:hypothetical protein
MLDAIKPLLDSDLINEDTRQAIAEQWEAKLNEAREQFVQNFVRSLHNAMSMIKL